MTVWLNYAKWRVAVVCLKCNTSNKISMNYNLDMYCGHCKNRFKIKGLKFRKREIII
jgi:hypothetical protein